MSENAIEIVGLRKSYGGFELGPLNLTAPRGAIYGLIGPNGAGKTCTLDLIFGMGRNEGGVIRVLGLDHINDEVSMKRRCAYVSPELNYADWRVVGRAIRFVRGFYPTWDDAYCRTLMARFGLRDNQRIATLSFGNKIKLALLLGLSHRPEVLILDEPTVGLDAIAKKNLFEELMTIMKEGDRTVVMSSHALSDIERFADHVGIIDQGKMLTEGPMDALVDGYRMVDFNLPRQAPLKPAPGVRPQRRVGNRARALCDWSDGPPPELERLGATDIAAQEVALEELFVALTAPHCEPGPDGSQP